MANYLPRTGLCLIGAVAVAGCGSSGTTKTVTQTSSPLPNAAGSSAKAQNNQVIQQAAQSSDNQAQLGAGKIKAILVRKLGMDDALDFNLSHHISPDASAGDCYVKLGAEAVNFENQAQNILRSPNGQDVVFVQADTTTPLVKCLTAVRDALGW